MLLAPLLAASLLQADPPVRVDARLDHQEVEVGEDVIFRVEVVTDGARAQIQPMGSLPPGLRVITTRDWDQRQFSLPGGTRRFVSREFTLRASAPGRYRIPSVTAVVDGRTYASEPVLLSVLPAVHGAGPPHDPDDVILRAWTDRDTVYVGQQVTLHVEAMFSRQARLRLRRAPEYEPATPSGFWVRDIPDPSGVRTGRGDVYESQTFRRALFPLSPGSHQVPPARLHYEMRRGILHAPEVFTLATDPIPLEVMPVPDDGRPAAFTGAVGRFDVTARIEPDRVAAGDAVVLTVEVTGTGNIRALPAPRLPDLPGVRTFPPSEEAHARIEDGVLQGRKEFTWVLLPRHEGELRIEAVEYAYFDPALHAFETATAAPLALTVLPGATIAETDPGTGVRYLKTTPGQTHLAWVGSPRFLAAQAIPLLLVAGALLVRRRGRAPRQPATARMRRRRRALLAELERRADGDDPAFFGDAAAGARQWLVDRLGLEPGTLAGSEVTGALEDAGVDPATAAAVAGLLARLDAARYSPRAPGQRPGPGTRRELVRRLGELLERIDGTPPGSRASAALVLAGLALAAPGFHAAPLAAQPPHDPFAEGVRLFDRGDYAEAATAFDGHLAHRPHDPAGWYNLGTAAHRAGEPGRAAHAWLRALHLDPRDGDTRHNLATAGVPPELVRRAAGPVPLRSHEWLLLAAVAWFAAGVAAALWVLKARPSARATAALALGLALVLAAGSWHSTRGAETLIMLDGAPLRAGPSLNAEALAALRPGSGLVPVAHDGTWIRARTFDGQEGWVEAITTDRIRIP